MAITPTRDEFVVAAPAPALVSYVVGYSGYWQEGAGPAVHRGLPSPFLTLIFTIEHRLRVSRHPNPAQASSAWRTLVGGLHLSPALIVHDGAQSGIQAMVTPRGARALLGLPASELVSLDVDAADLMGRAAERLSDQLAEAPDWPARFALVDHFLLQRAQRAAPPGPSLARVDAAWRLLQRYGGSVSIAAVADRVQISARTLRDGFAAEFGLTPKQAARMIRFDRARRRLAASAATGTTIALAELAASCGYADQAHLTREFAVFAGLPPAAWLTESLRAGADSFKTAIDPERTMDPWTATI